MVTPQFNSNYHALQSQLQRRFGEASQFNVAYTWSKNLTDNQTDRSTAPQNSYNIGQDRGRADARPPARLHGELHLRAAVPEEPARLRGVPAGRVADDRPHHAPDGPAVHGDDRTTTRPGSATSRRSSRATARTCICDPNAERAAHLRAVVQHLVRPGEPDRGPRLQHPRQRRRAASSTGRRRSASTSRSSRTSASASGSACNSAARHSTSSTTRTSGPSTASPPRAPTGRCSRSATRATSSSGSSSTTERRPEPYARVPADGLRIVRGHAHI